MDTTKYRIGVVQLHVRTNRIEDNLRRAAALVQQARQQGCSLVVLPEAFATGLDLPQCRERATPIPGRMVDWIAALARQEGVYLAAGLLEHDDTDVYSTVVLLSDKGELLHQHRRMLIYELESYFLTAGQSCTVVETELGRIGFVVGYDIQFPETTRPLFIGGVELLICPAILMRSFTESIHHMALARAAENSCYLLLASATGENTLAGLTFMGNSLLLQSPIGTRPYSRELRRQEPILQRAGVEETVLCADLDMNALRHLQRINPLRRDLRSSRFWPGMETPVAKLEES